MIKKFRRWADRNPHKVKPAVVVGVMSALILAFAKFALDTINK